VSSLLERGAEGNKTEFCFKQEPKNTKREGEESTPWLHAPPVSVGFLTSYALSQVFDVYCRNVTFPISYKMQSTNMFSDCFPDSLILGGQHKIKTPNAGFGILSFFPPSTPLSFDGQ
jgi:hypothetical protein